jgi:ribonuclease Z
LLSTKEPLMSITYQVLGTPGKDNAALVHINTGKTIHRLLFDCGEACLAEVGLAEVQKIDHLCFSHLHMDHVGGFDSFFRATFNRTTQPNQIWGPPDAGRLISYRMRAYQWNFRSRMSAVWTLNDVHPDQITHTEVRAREGFARRRAAGATPLTNDCLIDDPDYTLTVLTMDHLIPSLAYVVREQPRLNIDEDRMAELGLRPGIWLRAVKGHIPDAAGNVTIDGRDYTLEWLREQLLVRSPGASFAYLTDFLMDDAAIARLVPALRGCDSVVCECSYTEADRELALRYHHMYPGAVARLARQAEIGELVLFHVSDRYSPHTWLTILAETRASFPNTNFAPEWQAHLPW